MELNSLPLVAQLEVFAHLSVREVMKVRRVCKQWNRLINTEFRLQRLRCYQMRSGERSAWHEFNFHSIRSFLDYTSTDMKFSNVKSLQASLAPNYDQLEDALNFLNSFRSLEDVRFACSMDYRWEMNRELEKKTLVVNLDRLRKAEFYLYWGEEANWEAKISFLLDLPSLVQLTVNSWKGVTLKEPEKLRTLSIYGLFKRDQDYSKFTSLSNIYTTGSDVLSISARFIESLPSLRELHLEYGSNSNRPSVPPSSKTTARIFYYGFEISLNQINQINLEAQQLPSNFHEPNEETTEFIARNLHQSVNDNSFIKAINYNAMARALDDSEMFIVVPRKFPKISYLYIHGAVADANRLLKFITHLSISYLDFERASLPQWFFEKLAANGSFIRTLLFDIEPTMDILSGDFDFVFKLENLQWFSLGNRSLPLNFVIRLLEELKSIEKVSFYHTETYWFMIALQDHMWEIQSCFYGEHNRDEGVNDEFIGFEVNDLHFRHKFSVEEVPELMGALASRLKADGVVYPRDLLLCLHQLQLEEQTALFWMRKYIYDHTHSICLTLEQMMRLCST